MGAPERFSCDGPHGVVRLYIPDVEEVRLSATHAGFVVDDLWDVDDADDDATRAGAGGDAPGPHQEAGGGQPDYPAAVDADAMFRFLHPVWWRSPYTCQPDEDDGECACGRVSLLEVLDTVDDPAVRQAALDAHLAVTKEAWDHYWSAEALQRGGQRIGGACPDCLVEGEPHGHEVAGEAAELATELGCALAAFHTLVLVGDTVYDPADSHRPLTGPDVADVHSVADVRNVADSSDGDDASATSAGQ
jgi:hypothetical protein